MIKVTVLYPNVAGARFDYDYHRERHMPLVAERLGAACLSYGIERGLQGAEPGSDPPYLVICYFLCETIEAFQAALAPHYAEISADVANYTDITPVSQISAVVPVPDTPSAASLP